MVDAKMSRLWFAFGVILLQCGVCLGQQASELFAKIDAAFGKNRTKASELFQEVRRGAGVSFEPELWKYLGDDIDKQSRISSFLVYPAYLHGSLPMPNLARQIDLKTLTLLAEKSDRSSRTAFVTASVNVAVESAALEYRAEAERHKRNVQQMLASDRSLVAGLPAMTDYENCVYDLIGNPEIPSPARACLTNKTPDDPKVTVIELGEIESERVISRPEPRWPQGTKSGVPQGTINVRVLIDENGKVESAAAISESPALKQPVLTAVSQARFKKVIYQGNPVKAWGWLFYGY